MNLIDKFHHWRRRRRWNKQYRKGRWESLKSDREKKRYAQLLEYLQKYAKDNPSIMDLGCGDGVLNERIEGYSYEYFLGVDFSSVSIEKAKEKQFPNSEFITKDILEFVPERKFDVIIFNEAFYYIPETEKWRVLNLMLDNIKPGGILITSVFRDGPGVWHYFKENDRLKELDFTTIYTDKESTYWKMGVYSVDPDK